VRILFLLLLILVAGSPLSAQNIRIVGGGNDPAVRALQELFDRGRYRVIDRDTTLGRDSYIADDLVIVDARVAMEGTVAGSVAVVGGDLFIRPSATVSGTIVDIWDAYPSGLAQIGPMIRVHPSTRVAVTSEEGGFLVTLTRPPPPGLLRPRPVFGILLPTYDRVSGLTVGWGTELGIGGDTAAVSLVGGVTYSFARKRVGGSLELIGRPSKGSFVSLRASRAARTRDRWVRGDFPNTVSSLFVRSDVRDYYESDEVELTIGRAAPRPLIEGERFFTPRIGVRVSEDRSLETADPWTLFNGGEAWRQNPSIDEGQVQAAFVGVSAGWRGITTRGIGNFEAEWAPPGTGDFEFAQLRAGFDWSMVPWPLHRLDARAYGMLTVSGTAPGQRWSSVGGVGTLPTLDLGGLRGDRLLFVETAYLYPLSLIRLPVVGAPSLRLDYAAGAAWPTGGERPDFAQNVGVGLQVRVVRAMVHFDPAERPRRGVFSFGIEVPLIAAGRSF
jgi:hypothetical protein